MTRWTTLALSAALGFASPAWSQSVTAPRPALKVGEVSTYAVNSRHDSRNYDEKITITEAGPDGYKAKVELANDPTRTRDLVMDADLGTVMSSNGSRFTPAARTLKFPLEVGASWESRSDVVLADGGKSRLTFDSKVAGVENVRTPAGEFEAFRIETRGGIQGLSWNGYFRVVQTQWYAPSLQRVVRSEYKEQRTSGLDTVRELKAVEPTR